MDTTQDLIPDKVSQNEIESYYQWLHDMGAQNLLRGSEIIRARVEVANLKKTSGLSRENFNAAVDRVTKIVDAKGHE